MGSAPYICRMDLAGDPDLAVELVWWVLSSHKEGGTGSPAATWPHGKKGAWLGPVGRMGVAQPIQPHRGKGDMAWPRLGFVGERDVTQPQWRCGGGHMAWLQMASQTCSVEI